MKTKIINSVLVLLVFICGFSSMSYANPNQKVDEATIRVTNNVTIDGNTIIGTVEITTNSISFSSIKGIETKVIIHRDYTIFPDYQEEYAELFKDRTDQSVVLISNNNDIYVDGEMKNYKEMGKTITEDGLFAPAVADTGGLPAICHYYSTTDRTSYAFRCYESMNYNWVGEGNGHGEPEGGHVSKIGITPSNTWFASARNDVNLFENAYSDYRTLYAATLAEAAIYATLLTWLGPVGIVSAGLVTSASAGAVIALFNQAVAAEEKAYNTILLL